MNLARWIKVTPYTKEAVRRAYELDVISFDTMSQMIKQGQIEGSWL